MTFLLVTGGCAKDREHVALMDVITDKVVGADDRDRPSGCRMQELVHERYLRQVPLDPVTDRVDTWVLVPPPGQQAGVIDVRSGANGVAKNGGAYGRW